MERNKWGPPINEMADTIFIAPGKGNNRVCSVSAPYYYEASRSPPDYD